MNNNKKNKKINNNGKIFINADTFFFCNVGLWTVAWKIYNFCMKMIMMVGGKWNAKEEQTTNKMRWEQNKNDNERKFLVSQFNLVRDWF